MNANGNPLVSCIMPTYNRRAFIPHAIRYFLRQHYPNKELIIIDDGTDSVQDLIPTDIATIRYIRLNEKITLGAKLNMACEYAKGEIIANWDDDDWYAPHRLSYQVEALQEPSIELCGINQLLYFHLKTKEGFLYRYPDNQRIWLLGSSLCYTKSLWQRNHFVENQIGMDGLFVWATPPTQVKALNDFDFSVHMIHAHNVSPKQTDNSWWHPFPVDGLQKTMGKDWQYYTNGEVPCAPTTALKNKPQKTIKVLKNVFACLVHEKEDCILDLVRNLQYHDPSSTILLYNGSPTPHLISNTEAFKPFNIVWHPKPTPQRHGYLHGFTLDCMAYALEHFTFDTFTVVDSDQLCIRSGYSRYLTDFFKKNNRVGLLSSAPEQVTRDNRTNATALQAFREYSLWQPLLESFPNGEAAFVHWTFWPSTVFTFPAVRDVCKLFQENQILQQIMQHTKIWATEEVIFPTLVKLLGYDIAQNPCTYDYVKYKQQYNYEDMNSALSNTKAYWVHPVERQWSNPIRQFLREQFKNYAIENKSPATSTPLIKPTFSIEKHLDKMRKIEGWLSDNEASLLLATLENTFLNNSESHHIVEIGSYHGKTTVLMGSFINTHFPNRAIIQAIDTHDGKLGAADKGLQQFPPSYEKFKQNIETAGLSDIIVPIKSISTEVAWDKPISFLFIDGLHDYENVSKDFRYFSTWITEGGYVGFHDYADYFPGVKAFVNELLATGIYQKNRLCESLIVLQKTIEQNYKIQLYKL